MPVFLYIYGQLKVIFWIFFTKSWCSERHPPLHAVIVGTKTFYMTLRWGAHLSFPQFFIVGKSLRVQITCKCVRALAFRIRLCLEATHIKDSHHCKIIVEKEYCVVMTRTFFLLFLSKLIVPGQTTQELFMLAFFFFFEECVCKGCFLVFSFWRLWR